MNLKSFRLAYSYSALLAILFAGVLSSVPSQAYASTDVTVRQVLPFGAQACPQLGVSDVHPYIYDGALHSFDISITDPSYVAIAGQVGGMAVPFNQMTRWGSMDGSVRLHVDIETLRLSKATPITLTLLSTRPGGQPVTCVASVSSVIPAVSQRVAYSAPTKTSTHKAKTVRNPASYRTAAIPAYTKHIPYPRLEAVSINKKNTGTKYRNALPIAAAVQRIPLVTASHSLGNLCTSPIGSTRLWSVLSVLYAAFVLVLIAQKDKDSNSDVFTRRWGAALITLVFAALLFFWYFSALCRTGAWAPIVSTLIAGIGLYALAPQNKKSALETLLLRSALEDREPVIKLGGTQQKSAL